MGNFSAYGIGARRRFGAAQLFAFLAIFLHIATPLSAQLSSSATDGLFETVICSGGEWKTVYLDAEGKPVEHAPAKASHDCTSCIHHCGGAILSALASLPVLHWTQPLPVIAGQAALIQAHTSHTHPRAPPA
ncbi:MAG: DUF2946 family protein [Alphaproteobacteria bacterium]|nr:DUF2946 family protein [Alphaproteobacteria bacterium]MDX5415466.1 DUF2946 family protein [Alphaproteobacteria bacterium]MDX5492697.1 DUF2946 family protein [Alphaproteobacteria bacterium]